MRFLRSRPFGAFSILQSLYDLKIPKLTSFQHYGYGRTFRTMAVMSSWGAVPSAKASNPSKR